MSKYESVIIVDPNADENKLKNLEKFFTDMINKDGKLEKVENCGKKKLLIAQTISSYYTP